MSNSNKVIVVGLDGGSFNVLDLLIKEGHLPNVAALMDHGVRGNLETCFPPVTGPAWASFMTGKWPGGHGLFDFFYRVPKDWRRKIVDYHHIKSKTIWSLLNENGKTSCALNVPLTYPPPQIDGCLVSGMLTPSTKHQYTYPESLAGELEARFGPYVIDVYWQNYEFRRIRQFLSDLLECTRRRGEVMKYLMENRSWDFFMTVFVGTDRIQHALWDFLCPETEKGRSKFARDVRQLIIRYYELIDSYIGWICKTIEDKGNIFVMSDHGFGPLKGKLFVNKWLADNGFLNYHNVKRRSFLLKNRLTSVLKWIPGRLDISNLTKKLPVKGSGSEENGVNDLLACIDWSRTKAYSASNTEQGIYINLSGRESEGIVQPGKDYERVRDTIIEKLRRLTHPYDGKPMVSQVRKREDVYSGPFVREAPDILFAFRDGEYSGDVKPVNQLIQDSSWTTGSGTHRMKGIFMGWGKDIKYKERVHGTRIVDIVPTICYLMDVPIPAGIDGNLLTGILNERFLEARPPMYSDSSDVTDSLHDEEKRRSKEDSAYLKEQLKGLGYM